MGAWCIVFEGQQGLVKTARACGCCPIQPPVCLPGAACLLAPGILSAAPPLPLRTYHILLPTSIPPPCSWAKAICLRHGAAIQAGSGAAALPALRSLQKALTRLHEDLAATCEANQYALEYITTAGQDAEQQDEEQQQEQQRRRQQANGISGAAANGRQQEEEDSEMEDASEEDASGPSSAEDDEEDLDE